MVFRVIATASIGIAMISWIALLQWAKVRRPKRPMLALMERWYAASPKRRRVVAAIPKWTLDIEGTKQLVQRLLEKYALLRSEIIDGEWHEKSQSNIEVELYPKRRWEDVAEQLLTENPNNKERLWRVALVENAKTLVIMLDHVLSDGLGLAGLVDDICNGVIDCPADPLPVALEDLLDVSISSKFVLGKLRKKQPTTAVEPFVGPFLLGDEMHQYDQTIIRSASIKSSDMDKIKRACRGEQTTVHTWISANASKTLQKLLGHPLTVKLLTPISLRHRARFTTVLGNYVAPHEFTFEMDENVGKWDLARSIKASLSQTEGLERELGLINLLPNIKEYLEKREKQHLMGRSATIEVSNLGRCATTQDWIFAQGNHYVGPLLAVNVVSVESGNMFITVTARSLCVNRQALEVFTNALAQSLLELDP